MDAQYPVLKQISIRINEYINGDIELSETQANHFFDQTYTVFREEPTDNTDPALDNLLAYYVLSNNQQATGKVFLVPNNLEKNFWKLFVEIKKHVPRLDKNSLAMNTLAQWIVANSYWQQQFHHQLAQLRLQNQNHNYNFSDTTTRDTEAALAIVYAYHKVHETMQYHDFPDLWEWFIKKAFRYSSAGFKDWFLYLDEAQFWEKFAEISALPAIATSTTESTPLLQKLEQLVGVHTTADEAINSILGNPASEMGRFVSLADLFGADNELYLMWLTPFRWQAADIISFLLSLPSNGFSVHIGIADGDLGRNWKHWIAEHTDIPTKRVIIDMPKGIERDKLYFLLDGEQRLVILFLVFFIKAVKAGNAQGFFINPEIAKLALISHADNVFFNALLDYLQHGGTPPNPASDTQKKLLNASIIIEKWLALRQNLEDVYAFLIGYQSRESNQLPFKYTDKNVRQHKLINCSIY